MKLEEVNQRTKEAVDFLVAALESGHSEVLTAYLCAMAKFHTYSFGNIMLIARQKPEATNVAGIRTWNSLGRCPNEESGVVLWLRTRCDHRYIEIFARSNIWCGRLMRHLTSFRIRNPDT